MDASRIKKIQTCIDGLIKIIEFGDLRNLGNLM
jgi:hypothetical protein